MAAQVVTAFTVIGTGVAVSGNVAATTAGTITAAVTDLSRTFFRLQNVSTTASCALTLSASVDPMVAHGIGTLTVTLTTAQTQYIGASWDGARFKGTAGTIVFTVPAGGTVNVEGAIMAKY